MIPPCPLCGGRLTFRIAKGGGVWESNDCVTCKVRWVNDPPRAIEELREETDDHQEGGQS